MKNKKNKKDVYLNVKRKNKSIKLKKKIISILFKYQRFIKTFGNT